MNCLWRSLLITGWVVMLCASAAVGLNTAMIDSVEVSPSTDLVRGREYDFTITVNYYGEGANILIGISSLMEQPSGAWTIRYALTQTRAPGPGSVKFEFRGRVGPNWCNGAQVVVGTSPAGGGNGASEVIRWSAVQAPISFGWSPENPSVGEEVVLAATIEDSNAQGTWIWRVVDGSEEHVFNGQGANFSYAFEHAGDNFVQVKWIDACGHHQAVSDYVHVSGTKPIASFDWSPQPAMAGEEVEFTSTAYDPGGGDIVKWFWYIDGNGDATGTYLEGETVTYVFGTSGQKQIHHIVENAQGMRDNIRTFITIGEPSPVEASFILDPMGPCSGTEVAFDARGSKGDIAYYRWDFGDGSEDEGSLVSHTYEEGGHFHVTLTVEAASGATATAYRGIDVTDCGCVNDFNEPELVLQCGEPSYEADGGKVVISWSATDDCTGASDLKYHYSLDDDSWSNWSSQKTVTLSQLGDGYHSFCVEAIDKQTNTAKECLEFEVSGQQAVEDTAGPVIKITRGPIECTDSGGKVKITWTIADNVSSPNGIDRKYWLEDEDGGLVYESPWSASHTGNTFTGLSAGNYVFVVAGEDEAGNTAEAETSFSIECGGAPGTTAGGEASEKVSYGEAWFTWSPTHPTRGEVVVFDAREFERSIPGVQKMTWSLSSSGGITTKNEPPGEANLLGFVFPKASSAAATPLDHSYHVGLWAVDSSGALYWGEETVEIANSSPQAGFSWEPQSPMPHTPITFDASLSYDDDGDTLVYRWEFGDNTQAEGRTVVHTYTPLQDAQTYAVTLVVRDTHGGETPVTRKLALGSSFSSIIENERKRSWTWQEEHGTDPLHDIPAGYDELQFVPAETSLSATDNALYLTAFPIGLVTDYLHAPGGEKPSTEDDVRTLSADVYRITVRGRVRSEGVAIVTEVWPVELTLRVVLRVSATENRLCSSLEPALLPNCPDAKAPCAPLVDRLVTGPCGPTEQDVLPLQEILEPLNRARLADLGAPVSVEVPVSVTGATRTYLCLFSTDWIDFTYSTSIYIREGYSSLVLSLEPRLLFRRVLEPVASLGGQTGLALKFLNQATVGSALSLITLAGGSGFMRADCELDSISVARARLHGRV